MSRLGLIECLLTVRYSGLDVKELASTKEDFRKNAVKVLADTGADHVVYCHVEYSEDGTIKSADFYSNLQMDEKTFHERTSTMSGNDYIGAVHRKD